MLPQPNHRRGGQPGNQNARKHGFYSSVLTGEDRRNLRQASEVTGLDDEIALVRARLKSIVEHDPDNVRLISEAASTLVRLMRANHKLGFGQKDSMEEETNRIMLFKYGTDLGLSVEQVAALFYDGFDGLHKQKAATGTPDNEIFSRKKPIVSPEK